MSSFLSLAPLKISSFHLREICLTTVTTGLFIINRNLRLGFSKAALWPSFYLKNPYTNEIELNITFSVSLSDVTEELDGFWHWYLNF